MKEKPFYEKQPILLLMFDEFTCKNMNSLSKERLPILSYP